MIPPRIIKLIPKLETPHDGELVAVRDAIGKLLRAAGHDWHDLAQACGSPASTTASSRRPRATRGHMPSFGDLARACRDLDQGRLAAHERTFVMQMCSRGFAFQPSSKQADWLASLFDRLQGKAAA